MASIPLSVIAPPIENPAVMAEQASRVALARQAYQQRGQMGPEELRAAQLANQKAQMEADAVAAINKAYQDGYAAPDQAPPQTPPQAPNSMAPATEDPTAPHPNAAPPAAAPPPNSMAAVVGNAPPAAGAPAPAPPPQNSMAPAVQPPAPKPAAPATPGRTALPPYDFSRVIASLAQSGQGRLIPGQMQAHTEMLTRQATLLKDQIQAHTTLATQAGQLLQGIAGNPNLDDAGREQAYQRILPQLTAIERQMGADPSQIPQHYDRDVVTQMLGNASTVADWNSRQHQVADLAHRIHTDLPKSVAEAETQVRHDIGNVSTQQQYEDVIGKYRALAAEEQRRDPQGTSVYASALRNFPTEWKPDISLQAQLEPLKPEERVTFFQKRLELTAQKLGAAAQQGRDAYAAQLARTDPDEAALFPPAPPTGAAFDPASVARTANEVGMSGTQRITAQNTMQYRDELLGIRQTMAGIAQQNANIRAAKVNPTASAKSVANKLFTGNASDPDKALEALHDSTDPTVIEHAVDVEKILNQMKADRLKNQNAQGQIDKRTEDQKMMDTLLGNTPAKPGAPKPAAAPKPTAAPKQAAPPPPAVGKVIVYDGNGTARPFDSEEQAKHFEALVQNAGGSTSRQAPTRQAPTRQ